MPNSVLDANDYIPDPMDGMPTDPLSNRWNGQGPMQAAQGNIGGLQRALQNPGPSVGMGGGALSPRTMPFDQQMSGRIADSMMSRIRSPEQLQSAADARRGALEQLVRANSRPDNDLPWTQNYLAGIAEAPYHASGSMATNYGIKRAADQMVKSHVDTNQKEVQNALARLNFEQNEERSADSVEKSALGDAARILAVQARPQSAASIKAGKTEQWMPGIGFVDISKRDENGKVIPQVIMPAPTMMRAYDEARKQGQILANSDGFRESFKDANEMNAFIDQYASNAVAKSAKQWGLPENIVGSMPKVIQSIQSGGDGSFEETPATPAGQSQVPNSKRELLYKALPMVESNNNQAAVSSAGAIGKWQVMPTTGPEAAQLAGVPWDPVRFKQDAAYNETLGRAYLDKQLETFGNSPVFAAAAYNMGPAAFQKWRDKGGKISQLPQETREYVGKVQLQMELLAHEQGQQSAPQASQQPDKIAALVQKAVGNELPAPAAGMQAPTPAQNAPTAPANGTAAPVQQAPGGMVNPTIKTKAQQQQQIEAAKGAAAADTKLFEEWDRQAQQGGDDVNHLTTIRQLINGSGFVPGKDANFDRVVGSALSTFGIDSGLTKRALTATEIQAIVGRMVNDRVSQEKGVQTDKDVERFAQTYPKITDQRQAVDFGLNHLQELAERQVIRQQFMEQMRNSSPDGLKNMRQSWKQYMEQNIGPVMINYNGNPVIRNQFIAEATKATLEQYPDADPARVKQMAEQKWLQLAGQETRRTGR